MALSRNLRPVHRIPAPQRLEFFNPNRFWGDWEQTLTDSCKSSFKKKKKDLRKSITQITAEILEAPAEVKRHKQPSGYFWIWREIFAGEAAPWEQLESWTGRFLMWSRWQKLFTYTSPGRRNTWDFRFILSQDELKLTRFVKGGFYLKYATRYIMRLIGMYASLGSFFKWVFIICDPLSE